MNSTFIASLENLADLMKIALEHYGRIPQPIMMAFVDMYYSMRHESRVDLLTIIIERHPDLILSLELPLGGMGPHTQTHDGDDGEGGDPVNRMTPSPLKSPGLEVEPKPIIKGRAEHDRMYQ